MDRQLNVKPKKKFRLSKVAWLVFGLCYVYGIYLIEPFKIHRERLAASDIGGSAYSYCLAPKPEQYEGAVIQVYAARTWGTKKILAVHTWIATKRQAADHYQVSQIIGWALSRNGTALFTEPGIPDKSWYGNEPTLLLDKRGSEAELLIGQVEAAIETYPYADTYTVWPGPNSNTFIAWLGLEVPELGLDLPSTAIGKDWRPWKETFGWSASGTGVQASVYGLLGLTVGFQEGLEVNVLGLSMEVDVFDLALELPAVGRVGTAPVDIDGSVSSTKTDKAGQ
ncbi:DUF3750 domain-containing protein [Imperialibacter roseus]|uniref:DUF3750 domain-containing protein n=1 Tax=Imperialibacter roseus TaxID=1324217 RepID=A0ABZ0J0R5_9BACT|nr:DUF3750 domain-containing protein [Imperialibacter roseus]WOK09516.1 DUF3750 domain-containing protein [Imperialibacter roseus]